MCNHSKKSVALDLRKPPAAQALRDLARKSDVLIENFKPGTLEKYDCGYGVLSSINP